MPFARRMLETAIGARGEVPLTMGCSSLAVSRVYADLGIELLQFHNNFPGSEQELRRHIESALQLQEELARPIWFTEVQRVRAVSGWGDEQPPGEDLSPDLASVVPVVQEYGLPWFFWSLMVKRAYLPAQRAKGTVNGLFWEDGAVWSLADARAVAGDAELVLEERAEGL